MREPNTAAFPCVGDGAGHKGALPSVRPMDPAWWGPTGLWLRGTEWVE